MAQMLSSTATQTLCPPLPPCPVCGGLECLCRPRFFAGQLLSEEDLRALDHYVIEKNKLHNRYLHGWGVVCGLEVLCHECKGWVTIKQGYALDPCGNDIIVCKDYPFDVCAAINKCCDRKRKDWECEPMAGPPPDCTDEEQCWFVTLRYREFESRGITALKSSSQSSGCACGSADCRGGCGCGCHNGNGYAAQAKNRTTVSARRPAAQCEPTRTCESFVVELAPAPTEEREDLLKLFAGTFLEQVLACAKDFAMLQPVQNEAFDVYKKRVWEFEKNHPLTSCRALSAISSASASSELTKILEQLLRDCVCRALLPPCPSDVFDPRVILACVTVRRDATGCSITHICHQRGRRFVLTAPNMLYWVSIGGLVKQVLENVCCKEESPRQEIADVLITDVTFTPTAVGRAHYVVNVKNLGPDAAKDVTLSATLTISVDRPFGAINFLPSGDWTKTDGNSFVASLGTLARDDVRTLSFDAIVEGGLAIIHVMLTVVADVKTSTTESNYDNNMQTAQVLIEA
jgi:Domain of unknown function DUF11